MALEAKMLPEFNRLKKIIWHKFMKLKRQNTRSWFAFVIKLVKNTDEALSLSLSVRKLL